MLAPAPVAMSSPLQLVWRGVGVRSAHRRRCLPERGDDVLAEQLDRLHHLVVGDGFGGHEELDLVYAGLLVQLDGFDALLRVAGYQDAAFTQGASVDIEDGLPGSCGAA